MIINDAHVHFFSDAFFAPLGGDKAIATLGWEVPGPPETLADRWIVELDRHQVSRAALIASVPGDAGSVAAAVARYPDRFVGFFMVDPTKTDAAETAAGVLDQPGMRGICLFPAMHRFAIQDDRVRQIFAAAAARPGTAVFVHCGVLSVGVRKKLGLPSRFDLRLGDPLAVAAVAVRHPTVPVILPHFGAGLFREALMAADAASNIVLDSSSSNGWIKFHPGLTLRDAFARALDCVGPARILFGTDSSFFPRGWQQSILDAQRAVLADLGVDAAAQSGIFGGNFTRVLGG
jgi:uncharacterized protein